MPVENKFWQKSKYRFQHASTDFIKEVKSLWILEAAADRRCVKIYSDIYHHTPGKIPNKDVFLVKLQAKALKMY